MFHCDATNSSLLVCYLVIDRNDGDIKRLVHQCVSVLVTHCEYKLRPAVDGPDVLGGRHVRHMTAIHITLSELM